MPRFDRDYTALTRLKNQFASMQSNAFCIFIASCVANYSYVPQLIEYLIRNTKHTILIIDDEGTCSVERAVYLDAPDSLEWVIKELTPYMHDAYIKRYCELYPTNSHKFVDSYVSSAQRIWGKLVYDSRPKYLQQDLTEELLLQHVFEHKEDRAKVLWGDKYNCNGSTYIITEDLRVMSRKGETKGCEYVQGLDTLRNAEPSPELDKVVYSFLFKPITTRVQLSQLQKLAIPLGGLTASSWVSLLSRKHGTITGAMIGDYLPPICVSTKSRKPPTKEDIIFKGRKQLLSPDRKGVDGFTLEVYVPSRVFSGDINNYASTYLKEFKQLFIDYVSAGSWFKGREDLKSLLFVSSIDTTHGGFITATVAIKGGNIPYKEGV